METKFERLLNLVALLESAPQPLSAAEIRARLGAYSGNDAAFRRTFERDKADLLEMGVRLEVVTDEAHDPPVSAYRITTDRRRIADPGLDADELKAIRLATTFVALRDESLGEPADVTAALRKLGALGGGQGGDTLGEVAVDPALVSTVEAILAGRAVAFSYNGQPRSVAPRQVALSGGRWYLRGTDLERGELRTFRTDRIDGPVLLIEGPSHADDAPLAPLSLRPWEFGDAAGTEVVVRLDEVAAATALADDPDLSVRHRHDDGSVDVVLAVRNREGLWPWLAGFLERAELVGPPEAREEWVDRLALLVGTEAP